MGIINLERACVWYRLAEEPYALYNKEELRKLAEELKKIKVVPSQVFPDGHYYPKEESAFETDVIGKILKKYLEREDLQEAILSLEDSSYLLGRNIKLLGTPYSTVPELVVTDDNDELIGRSYLAGLWYIMMEKPDGHLYYVRIDRDKETDGLVAHIRPSGINEIDENSKILAIIRPQKDGKEVEIIRSGEIFRRKQKK